MQEPLSERELAEAAGVSRGTVRDYVRLFADYLPATGEGAQRRYAPACVAAVQTISTMSEAGQNSVVAPLRSDLPARVGLSILPLE